MRKPEIQQLWLTNYFRAKNARFAGKPQYFISTLWEVFMFIDTVGYARQNFSKPKKQFTLFVSIMI